MNSMEKIGGTVSSVLGAVNDTEYKSVLANDQIWVFQTKYLQQPNFHYGHRILFNGGSAASFDLNSNSWSPKVEFAQLSNVENMDEHLFVLNSIIYLLLYSHFGGIKYLNLYKWNIENKQWNLIPDFEVDPSCNIASEESNKKNDLISVIQSDKENGSYLFITFVDYQLSLHKLSISGSKAFIKPLLTLSDREQFHFEMPSMGTKLDDKVYIIGGIEGCGFRYNPSKLHSINIKTKEEEKIEVEGEQPSFAFGGPRYKTLLPNRLLYHATGHRTYGMTRSEFNGEIWSVQLGSDKCEWRKSSLVIPDMKTDFVAITDDEFIIVADHSNGVYKAKIIK